MALLFQSNPDQWDLRTYMRPGGRSLWFVNQYVRYMRHGVLTLFWEAQGRKSKNVRGLYGWGILLSEPKGDERGRLRVSLVYVERWVSAADVENKTELPNHQAPIQADDVLGLASWQGHRLSTMPIGTNFLVEKQQLEDLSRIVVTKYPASRFPDAVEADIGGMPLTLGQFEIQYVREGAKDG